MTAGVYGANIGAGLVVLFGGPNSAGAAGVGPGLCRISAVSHMDERALAGRVSQVRLAGEAPDREQALAS
jgi:hypothetical protein